jgi:hypothetical protein
LSTGTIPEQATALALAFIRQNVDLFDRVWDTHDRGRAWLQSADLIQLALVQIEDYYFDMEKYNKMAEEMKISSTTASDVEVSDAADLDESREVVFSGVVDSDSEASTPRSTSRTVSEAFPSSFLSESLSRKSNNRKLSRVSILGWR